MVKQRFHDGRYDAAERTRDAPILTRLAYAVATVAPPAPPTRRAARAAGEFVGGVCGAPDRALVS